MAAAKHDFTDKTRRRIYDTIIAILTAVVAVAAIWGVTVNQEIVDALTAILPALIGAAGAFLARRNVGTDYVGRHRAE